MVNTHYELESKKDREASGLERFYVNEGLPADFDIMLYRLNKLEELLKIPLTEWADPPGNPLVIGWPSHGVQHSVLGKTSLASAINYARVRAGTFEFPYQTFPTSATLGDGSGSNGINIRHPLEGFESIGRGLGGGSIQFENKAGSQNGPFADDYDIPKDETLLDDSGAYGIPTASGGAGGIRLGESGETYYALSTRVAGYGPYGIFQNYATAKSYSSIHVTLLDTRRGLSVGEAGHLMDDFELPNKSKISVISLGTGLPSSQPIFSVVVPPRLVVGISPHNSPTKWWIADEWDNYTGHTFKYQKVGANKVMVPDWGGATYGSGSPGSISLGSLDVLPTKVKDLYAGTGRQGGRYLYIVPPRDLRFERGGELIYASQYQYANGIKTYNPSVLSSYNYAYLFGAVVRVDGGVSNSSGNWLFWNEPVLPAGWPNDEMT